MTNGGQLRLNIIDYTVRPTGPKTCAKTTFLGAQNDLKSARKPCFFYGYWLIGFGHVQLSKLNSRDVYCKFCPPFFSFPFSRTHRVRQEKGGRAAGERVESLRFNRFNRR